MNMIEKRLNVVSIMNRAFEKELKKYFTDEELSTYNLIDEYERGTARVIRIFEIEGKKYRWAYHTRTYYVDVNTVYL